MDFKGEVIILGKKESLSKKWYKLLRVVVKKKIFKKKVMCKIRLYTKSVKAKPGR